MDLSSALPGLAKELLDEIMENHLLQFGEPAQAVALLKNNSPQVDSTWSSWERLQEVLHGLGFQW